MEAIVIPILRFLQGPKQFFIPIFQRRYSWEKQHCQQLWDDVLRIGENDEIKSHFLGSIVYMEPGAQNAGGITKLLVIDGQQRLTTLSILISALSRVIDERDKDIGITPKKLQNYYLFNDEEEGELRYKQLLTQHDKDTLIRILEDRELPVSASPRLLENYRLFETYLKDIDLGIVYNGIQKLKIVDIALDRNRDNPQLIFESLNSTGLSLSQADLIRNYVLMGQEPDFQNKLYREYWLPMEQSFGNEYTKRFDRFIRDYLTLQTRKIPNIRGIYEKFKVYLPVIEESINLEKTLENISCYAKHYVKIALLEEEEPELQECFKDIQDLRMEVTFPFLLEVYEDYKQGIINKVEIIEILRLTESYIFRRAICGIPTNSLNKTFAALMTEVDKKDYLRSLKTTFSSMTSYKRFPSDIEFKKGLISKDVYNFDRCNYLLRKLENYNRKELINVENYTIEHVMPQSTALPDAWKQELGDNFQEVQERYLHTIGNLTLTGYNPELSNRPFKVKQTIEGGFCDSPLRLNSYLAQQNKWDESTILERAKLLAEKALKIWINHGGEILQAEIFFRELAAGENKGSLPSLAIIYIDEAYKNVYAECQNSNDINGKKRLETYGTLLDTLTGRSK